MLVAQVFLAPGWLTEISGWVALGFLALLGIAVLWYIFTDASMSRFQLLVFTFVIAASLFLITASVTPPAFPAQIPQGVLLLLGISSSSYLVSKGIQFSSPEGVTDRGPEVKITGTSEVTTAGGKTIQFKADVFRIANNAVTWSLDPATGMGTIDSNGLYTPPPTPPAGTARPTGVVIVKATSVEDKALSDTATVTLA